MRRGRKQRVQATAEIRPSYSVAPDDDMYGSPRSWMGATMKTEGERERAAGGDGPAPAGETPSGTGDDPLSESELARYYRERRERSARFGADDRGGAWTGSAWTDPQRVRPDRIFAAHPPVSSRPRAEERGLSPLALQTIGSLFLVAAAFLVVHSDRSFAAAARNALRSAFAVDYTSVALPARVARVFGSVPSSGTAVVSAGGPKLEIVAPLKGAIVRPFSLVAPDVVISGRPGSPVYAAADGLVDSAGESQANGYYVTIDHGGFGQTFYAHLGRLAVHAHEYILAGETIGYLPAASGRLTFGYIRGGSYRNPKELLNAAR